MSGKYNFMGNKKMLLGVQPPIIDAEINSA